MLNFKRHTVGSIAKDTITAGTNFVRLGFNLIGATASVVKKGTDLAIDATKQGYNADTNRRQSHDPRQQEFDFGDTTIIDQD